MKQTLYGISALALVSALSACGGREEAANNVVANTTEMNAMNEMNGMEGMNDMNNMEGHDMNNMDMNNM